ncbi:nucleoside hydrolase [Nocardia bovistercoris]|uniref:Nucleoside hydrolase n=1 Tax=Nocardia bovistercoris TaxID=2785916 RepID=A0A931N3G4_9NOCA|nr:nucleoside hydrolase [Nocardia bovistercoris]MBH0777712.1 nucleoside hydrolase [Nocardia bovistercoris]
MSTTSPRTDRPLISTDPGGRVILSTDIGYDPDDTFALIAAAHQIEDLIVITTDEIGGQRAKLARRLLDTLGRNDVEVIEGIDLGGQRWFVPAPDQPISEAPESAAGADLERAQTWVGRVLDLVLDTSHPVRWVGCGPMSELSALLTVAPDLAEQIIVTQMGGALDHPRTPEHAEHNLATNPLAAGVALRILPAPHLVLADHTEHPTIRLTPDTPLIQTLDSDTAPEWARLTSEHFHRWVARGYTGSWMHDPLALTAALGHPFVSFAETRIRIGEDARLYRDPYGRTMKLSHSVDYEAFLAWLYKVISW